RIFSGFPGERSCGADAYLLAAQEEDFMRKFGYVVAAIVAVGIAVPSIAGAETVVIKHGDHDRYRDRDARAEYREHREFRTHPDHGWRHHADRVVIVKHRHHHEY